MNEGHSARRGTWPRVAAAVTSLSLLFLLAGGVLGVSPRTPNVVHAGTTDSVTITVGTAFVFTPTGFEVQPGDTVALTITQIDAVDHTFTVSSQTDASIPSGFSTTQITSYFHTYPPLVNLSINASPSTMHYSFPAPQKGYYEFVCLKSGHFQAGMAGFMGVGVPPPNLPSNTGPGAAVFIIGGVVAGLVVLAVVLAFIIGRRRGAAHEMPPERLGYSEPAHGPTKSP